MLSASLRMEGSLIQDLTAQKPSPEPQHEDSDDSASDMEYIQCDQQPPRLESQMDEPLAPLAYAHATEVQAVGNAELQQFLLQELGQPEASMWHATCIETGGGGDCFFHAVGSILEHNALQITR